MINDKLSILAVTVTVILLFAGCTGTAANNEESVTDDPADRAAQVVYGKIKEINGNEILLAIGTMEGGFSFPGGGQPSFSEEERPSFGEGERPALGEGERPNFPDGERPSRSEGEFPAFGEGEQTAFPDGERPSRGEGQRPTQGESQAPGGGQRRAQGEGQAPGAGQWPSGGQGQQPGGTIMTPPQGEGGPGTGQGGMTNQSDIELTGEESTYLIPVIADVSVSRGVNITELRFTQLAVKNVICLYLNEQGEIFAVRLLQ